MKHAIFNKSFDEVFTFSRLLYELSQLKVQPKDVESVRKEIKAGKFFGAEPRESFFLPKSDGSFRQITVSGTKTRIIQKVLVAELGNTLKFSDRSYAFQKGKSPYRAIRRVQDTLRHYRYIAKADIMQFFDMIDHEILVKKLRAVIEDARIIQLIAYYISLGYLQKNVWMDKSEGVYQGDVLSPLLSNIYLHGFDRYLEQRGIMHVRYADDMLFFGKTREETSLARSIASDFLAKIKLHFNPKKTYLSHLDKGFAYLGIHFGGNGLSIDTQRLSQKMQKLGKETRTLSLAESVPVLNEKITGFLNYYARIIDDKSQMAMLQQKLEAIVIAKIMEAKEKKVFRSKAQIEQVLEPLKSYVLPEHPGKWKRELISEAYSRIEVQTPLVSAKKQVAVEKRSYLQKQIKSSEIVISQAGAFLGFSRGKIKVKLHGKVVMEAPVNQIKRILLLNRQSSLSAYLIYECAKRKIDIDFIDHDAPYAMLTYPQHISPALHLEQLKTTFSPRGLGYAKEITRVKAKNQINLIKYLNRRRHSAILEKHIKKMQHLYGRIQKAKEKKVLMGIEGSISVQYWSAFGEVLGIDGFVRTHQNSKDEINQALNYGYAILYNRVQSALIHEGLNLHYPLYHAMQQNKPTLVYDMVEEFRQPVVDREILAMLNRGQKLTQTNGLLAKESIKLIVQHIQSRLATPAPSRYGKSTLLNIIGFQANHLKRTMLDQRHYKGFINKY